MARLPRAEVFDPQDVAIVHVINRVVRRCFLLGDDPLSGKNYDHRKVWIEQRLKLLASAMGIDLLVHSILSNHFHLVLRSRPDVVETWDDTEVARRWLSLTSHSAADEEEVEPTEWQLNSIRHDSDRVKEIRTRLSDISWWMRLLCQNIAQRANREDEETGKFWQSRFRAVRIVDETALLACAAYVDLNPIRAAMTETLEGSDHTSVQHRIEAIKTRQKTAQGKAARNSPTSRRPDDFLSPLSLDERFAPGPQPSQLSSRCSDKGFLPLSEVEYIELLDWTARHLAPGKRGHTPADVPPVLQRLNLSGEFWCALTKNFGRLFHVIAGSPDVVATKRTLKSKRRYRLTPAAREIYTSTSG